MRVVPRLCGFYPGICLTTEEKARKKPQSGQPNINKYCKYWHSEDSASCCILTMKANEKCYFSDLFGKVLYMFRTCPLSIIRSISTLYTRNMYFSCQFCWRQQDQYGKCLLRVYNVEILLVMDSGLVRNMQSALFNKFQKQCILLAVIIRM